MESQVRVRKDIYPMLLGNLYLKAKRLLPIELNLKATKKASNTLHNQKKLPRKLQDIDN